jgi:hypothetical protein
MAMRIVGFALGVDIAGHGGERIDSNPVGCQAFAEIGLALAAAAGGVSSSSASGIEFVMRSPLQLISFQRVVWWRSAALCLCTTVLIAWQYDRLHPSTWSYPTDYSGDAMEILARIKAASEGELVPFTRQNVSRLGAPFGTDWSEYLAPDGILIFGLGCLARLVGVGAAANLAVLLAQLTAAVSFYLCARWLRQRWEWAFAGALLFSFAFHSVFRGLSHLSLIYTWTVPPAILCCALIARSRRLRANSAAWYGCLALSAALAVSNPYNLFLFVQLLVWSVVSQWVGPRRRANLLLGLACAAVAAVVLVAVMLPALLLPAPERGQPLLVRNYGGTELYALKPIELLLPPEVHRSERLASLGDRYVRWSDLRGEAFSPYLGIIGGVGLCWLFGAAALNLLARRRVPDQALPAAWILAFSAVGGVNSLLAFYAGLQVFRATNRYSIFLSALVLTFVIGKLARSSQRWPRPLSLAAALAVVGFGLWDQLPRPDPRAKAAIAVVDRDRAFGALLDREFKPGAMLFQLPYIEFPEGRGQHLFYEYEHFRPYLATETVRFTFGARKQRARSQWQRDFEALAPGELVAALEDAGFAGIYLNRRAYADRGESLLQSLRELGRTEVIEGRAREQAVVRLRPAADPRLPVASEPTYGQGWNPPEPGPRRVRWTRGQASLSYYNPLKEPLPIRLHLNVGAVAPRELRLLLNGQEVIRRQVDETQRPLQLDGIALQPGVNRFDLVPDGPSVRQGRERNRLRNVSISSVRIELEKDAPLRLVQPVRSPPR